MSVNQSVLNAENKTLIDNLRSSLSSRKSGIGQAYKSGISLTLESFLREIKCRFLMSVGMILKKLRSSVLK